MSDNIIDVENEKENLDEKVSKYKSQPRLDKVAKDIIAISEEKYLNQLNQNGYKEKVLKNILSKLEDMFNASSLRLKKLQEQFLELSDMDIYTYFDDKWFNKDNYDGRYVRNENTLTVLFESLYDKFSILLNHLDSAESLDSIKQYSDLLFTNFKEEIKKYYLNIQVVNDINTVNPKDYPKATLYIVVNDNSKELNQFLEYIYNSKTNQFILIESDKDDYLQLEKDIDSIIKSLSNYDGYKYQNDMLYTKKDYITNLYSDLVIEYNNVNEHQIKISYIDYNDTSSVSNGTENVINNYNINQDYNINIKSGLNYYWIKNNDFIHSAKLKYTINNNSNSVILISKKYLNKLDIKDYASKEQITLDLSDKTFNANTKAECIENENHNDFIKVLDGSIPKKLYTPSSDKNRVPKNKLIGFKNDENGFLYYKFDNEEDYKPIETDNETIINKPTDNEIIICSTTNGLTPKLNGINDLKIEDNRLFYSTDTGKAELIKFDFSPKSKIELIGNQDNYPVVFGNTVRSRINKLIIDSPRYKTRFIRGRILSNPTTIITNNSTINISTNLSNQIYVYGELESYDINIDIRINNSSVNIVGNGSFWIIMDPPNDGILTFTTGIDLFNVIVEEYNGFSKYAIEKYLTNNNFGYRKTENNYLTKSELTTSDDNFTTSENTFISNNEPVFTLNSFNEDINEYLNYNDYYLEKISQVDYTNNYLNIHLQKFGEDSSFIEFDYGDITTKNDYLLLNNIDLNNTEYLDITKSIFSFDLENNTLKADVSKKLSLLDNSKVNGNVLLLDRLNSYSYDNDIDDWVLEEINDDIRIHLPEYIRNWDNKIDFIPISSSNGRNTYEISVANFKYTDDETQPLQQELTGLRLTDSAPVINGYTSDGDSIIFNTNVNGIPEEQEYNLHKNVILGNYPTITKSKSIIGLKIDDGLDTEERKISEYFCGKFIGSKDDKRTINLYNDLSVSIILVFSYKEEYDNTTITEFRTLYPNQRLVKKVYGYCWYVYKIGETDNFTQVERKSWRINEVSEDDKASLQNILIGLEKYLLKGEHEEMLGLLSKDYTVEEIEKIINDRIDERQKTIDSDIKGLILKHSNLKEEYNEGDKLDLTGIKIEVIYKELSKRPIYITENSPGVSIQLLDSNEKPTTMSTEGKKIIRITYSEKSYSESINYPITVSHVHKYNESYVSTEQEHYKICYECGTEDRESRESHTPYYIESERVNSTCTEAGHIKWVCSKCGYHYIEPLNTLGHSYDIIERIEEPSCELSGKDKHTCSRCGDYYIELVPKLGHDYSITTILKESTYTENGLIRYTCSRCGDSYELPIALKELPELSLKNLKDIGYSVYNQYNKLIPGMTKVNMNYNGRTIRLIYMGRHYGRTIWMSEIAVNKIIYADIESRIDSLIGFEIEPIERTIYKPEYDQYITELKKVWIPAYNELTTIENINIPKAGYGQYADTELFNAFKNTDFGINFIKRDIDTNPVNWKLLNENVYVNTEGQIILGNGNTESDEMHYLLCFAI